MEFKTGIDFKEPPPSLNGEAKKQIVAATESDFSGIDFAPAQDKSASFADSVQEVDESDLFSLATREFSKRVPDGSTQNDDTQPGQSAQPTQSKSLGEIMPEGMIDISSEMYVEILEGAVVGICQMFGDEQGNYLFNKVYKSKYTDITKTFFKYQNVQITPAQLFMFCTIAIISGSGLKAYKHRRARLSAEKFRKKTELKALPGQQAKLFELDTEDASGQRKNFAIDSEGYYEKDAFGKYAKKGEREKVPDYLLPFIEQYHRTHGKFPGKKEIDTFTKFE